MLRLSALLAALAWAAPQAPPKPPELTAHQRESLKKQGLPDTSLLNDATLRRLAESLPREPGGRASPAAASWLKLGLPSLRRALDRHERWRKDPAGFRALGSAARNGELRTLGEYLKPGALTALGTQPPPAAAASAPRVSEEERKKNTEWALDELWKAWQTPPPK